MSSPLYRIHRVRSFLFDKSRVPVISPSHPSLAISKIVFVMSISTNVTPFTFCPSRFEPTLPIQMNANLALPAVSSLASLPAIPPFLEVVLPVLLLNTRGYFSTLLCFLAPSESPVVPASKGRQSPPLLFVSALGQTAPSFSMLNFVPGYLPRWNSSSGDCCCVKMCNGHTEVGYW